MVMNFICDKNNDFYTAVPYENNPDNTRKYFLFNAKLILWCEQKFGPGKLNQRWWATKYHFWFRNEQDRTFFILKWQ